MLKHCLFSICILLFQGCKPDIPDYDKGLLFINEYLAYIDLNGDSNITDWINNRNDVSSNFKKELNQLVYEGKKADPELGLGFDPIIDAQDNPGEVQILHQDKNYLTVQGVEMPAFKLTLKLVKLDTTWFIDGSGIINIPISKRSPR